MQFLHTSPMEAWLVGDLVLNRGVLLTQRSLPLCFTVVIVASTIFRESMRSAIPGNGGSITRLLSVDGCMIPATLRIADKRRGYFGMTSLLMLLE